MRRAAAFLSGAIATASPLMWVFDPLAGALLAASAAVLAIVAWRPERALRPWPPTEADDAARRYPFFDLDVAHFRRRHPER
jgi:hypothetical protein